MCVITINCVFSFKPIKYLPNASTFTSSNAASTSSSIQNGAGLDLIIANNNEIAVNVFSPPDNNEIVVSFLPGGQAIISIPVSLILFGSVNLSSASPPPNKSLNVSLKFFSISLNED